MKAFSKIGLFLAVILISAAACTKDSPDPGGEPGGAPDTHADAKANRWIFENMAADYLYNAKAKAMTAPDYNQASEDFFQSLLSSDPNDNDGKHPATNGLDYFYSYLERLTDTRLTAGPTSTYGFEYVLYRYTYEKDGPLYYDARVLYVIKGSVAEKAGIVRGDWITKIGTDDISDKNRSLLDNGGAVQLSAYKLRGSSTNYQYYDERVVNLEASTTIDISPVFLDTIYAKGVNKIGYLVYHSFDYGLNNKYDTELRGAFARFKSGGVTHLIVDLRYNGGGYISCCQLLTSMILPQGNLGSILGKYKVNAELTAKNKYQDPIKFLAADKVSGAQLNLSKLYVLTSSATASSSELLINSLRPYMQVTIIGGQTEGKNVGSVAYTNKTYSMEFHPIMCQFFNANNQSDYKNGFAPDIPADDFGMSTQAELEMKPLGEDNEYLLSTAIEAITNGTRSGATAAVAAGAPFRRLTGISSLNRRGLKGAIVERIEF